MQRYETELEACKAWVGGFNAIPSDLLMTAIGDDWELLADTEDDETPEWPMWGTLWSFDNAVDDWWRYDHEETLLDLGFTIVKNEKYDYFYIGINGAGFDFYDAFWLPLYRARGLHWHKEVA